MRGRDHLEQLVRDHIPELARRARAGLHFRQAEHSQLGELMADKIEQEVAELRAAESRAERIDRLAAMYELIERLAIRQKVTMADLAVRAKELDLDKGSFRLGMVMIGKTPKEEDRG
jgi:predicted house-cleaning noncanonical NTP pyrophosphatase (MazG superfamily)